MYQCVFLFSASAFSILLLSAFTNESQLNEFGYTYLDNYVSHNRKLVDSALDQLESGHTQKSLDLLQKQFADIQKGDRLYPDKGTLLKIWWHIYTSSKTETGSIGQGCLYRKRLQSSL